VRSSYHRCTGALLLTAVLIGLSGCLIENKPPSPPPFIVNNGMSQPLTITVSGLKADELYQRVKVAQPHQPTFYQALPCIGDGATATDLQGTVVARLSQALCGGDTWDISADGTARLIRHS
jgi:hypothetical protein